MTVVQIESWAIILIVRKEKWSVLGTNMNRATAEIASMQAESLKASEDLYTFDTALPIG